MQFLRSRARRLSLLALFALAVQFALGFGHVHADFAPASPLVVASAPSSAPSGDHGGDSSIGHDACAICAVMAIAATGVASTPPTLPLPPAFATVRQIARTNAAIPSPRLRAFPPRGPPFA